MNFKQIITGKISKRELGWFYFPILVLVTIFWSIARALYPLDGGYYANFNVISRQGNILLNPIGGWFFIIGTALAGLLIIPYMIYVARAMAPTLKLINWLFLLCGILGGFGLMVVGLVPESEFMPQGEIHLTGATFAFAGLCGAVALSFLIMFVRILQKKSWPTFTQFSNLFWVEAFFLSMWFFTLLSVNQWAGFYIVLVWCTMMYMILPDNNDNNNLKQ